MELYILRHGEAGKRLQSTIKDSERGLTVAGQEEIVQIAKGVMRLGIKLNFIAASPLKRAYQTAAIIAKQLDVKRSNIEQWQELQPEGRRDEMYHRLAQFKQDSSIMVVGHEPYLSTMISEIVFGNGISGIALKKAGLARISIISFQPKIKGDLKWLLTPKHLKKVGK